MFSAALVITMPLPSITALVPEYPVTVQVAEVPDAAPPVAVAENEPTAAKSIGVAAPIVRQSNEINSSHPASADGVGAAVAVAFIGHTENIKAPETGGLGFQM